MPATIQLGLRSCSAVNLSGLSRPSSAHATPALAKRPRADAGERAAFAHPKTNWQGRSARAPRDAPGIESSDVSGSGGDARGRRNPWFSLCVGSGEQCQ